MRYENAKDILPIELLKEIQKYAAGKLLYVPYDKEKRSWGEASGYRAKLQKRNQMICNKYANGKTISELADEYYLSLDSIKKILYSKKNDKNLEYAPTLTSAVEYSNVGMTEEWLHSFLLFTCNAALKSQQLMDEEGIYYGIVKLPLRWVESEDMADYDSNKLIDTLGENGIDIPPLILKFVMGKFYVLVQKDLIIALKKRKVNAYPVIIIINKNGEYKLFMKNYGCHLLFINKV